MKDSDGNECDLPVMCMREPGWAASRIQALTGELEASRALHVEFFEEEERTRTLLKGLAARMRECRPLRSQDSGYVVPQSLVEDWADEIDKLIAEPGT